MAQDTAHIGASGADRVLRAWTPGLGSPDSDSLSDRGALTARARDLQRNNGIARGGYQTLVDSIVGTGLRLQAAPRWQILGQDRAWAHEWAQNTEQKWSAWADSPACDARDTHHFAELTRLALRSVLQTGELLCLPVYLPRPGYPAGTRLHLIEPDRLSNPLGRSDDRILRAGIEIDEYGAPQAYWIARAHPGDQKYDRGPQTHERIPARTEWGRRRVIHAAHVERIGQTRGTSEFAAVLKQFRILEKYSDAELQAAAVNAMVAAFIETPMDMTSIVSAFGGVSLDAVDDIADRQADHKIDFQPGSIMSLYPGEKLSTFAPTRPSGNYDPFVTSVLRHIATGLNLPYELLAKDWSRTNYSSARAAILEAWRYFLGVRRWLCDYWARPIYDLWLEEQIAEGWVEAPGYFDDPVLRAAWANARWVGPGRGWVDPVKEAQAAGLRIANGVSTLQAECAEQGADWEEVLEQQALEAARRRDLGLIPQAAASPANPSSPPESPDEQAAQ